LKDAQKNSAIAFITVIFSIFSNLHTYWRETPRQRTNNEDCWWKTSGTVES